MTNEDRTIQYNIMFEINFDKYTITDKKSTFRNYLGDEYSTVLLYNIKPPDLCHEIPVIRD